MRRFLITIEYIGTNYNGFQLQKNAKGKTVQGELEKALKQVFLSEVKVFASGRLDAGVHTNCLKAHFDVENNIDVKKIANAINHFLPDDISITATQEVPNTFHARYNVSEKTYQYVMYVSEFRRAMLDDRAKQLWQQPNITLMQKASEYLLGTHDFSAFMSQKSSVKTTVRTVKYITIEQKNEVITLTICGKGFLYNMVRIIVGTLLKVGYEQIKPEDVKAILESKDRKNAGKVVEAKALTLISVEY